MPQIFAPLSFELVRGEARRLFPGKEIRDDIPGYDGKERLKVTMVWGLQWPVMGASYISIAFDANGHVRWLTIETEETRQECLQPAPGAGQAGCRSAYGPELLQILRGLRSRLEKRYGLSRQTSGTVGASRERSYVWARDGFDIILSIDSDEEGMWAVSVHAALKPRGKPAK